MNDKKILARHLYLNMGMSQRDIALEVGVSERTIFTWIHQYAWKKLRQAAHDAPATIADNLSSHVVELQSDIASRDAGKRYPTVQEAEVMRKLILCITAMSKTQAIGQQMQFMESFRDFVRPLNRQFALDLVSYAERYFGGKAKAVTAYKPYQLAYGAEQFASVAPFYSELDNDTIPTDDTREPVLNPDLCNDEQHCMNPERCHYPSCPGFRCLRNDKPGTHPEIVPWKTLSEAELATNHPRPENPSSASLPTIVGNEKPANTAIIY